MKISRYWGVIEPPKSMSSSQWFTLMCIFVLYLFFGTVVFHDMEHTIELQKEAVQLHERISINELLVKNMALESKPTQDNVLKNLSNYCGRPVTNYTLDEYPADYLWTFFHSFWFTMTLCSTVGYGNISPRDQPGQVFVIFYALIGLPLYGFVLAYVGEMFTRTATRIYKYYRGHENSKTLHHVAIERFGILGSALMFVVPGFVVFIFLPALVFMYFEGWTYFLSAYYAYITLTTIGFGDYVVSFQDGQARIFGAYFILYEIFIIIWNFIGVAYFVACITFIAKGMLSKRVAHLEHQLSLNIKDTQHRIYSEITKDVRFLRGILNEAHMLKFKPVYTEPQEKATFHYLHRLSSCPDLSMYQNECLRKSKERTCSGNYSRQISGTSIPSLNQALSDGNLSRIDKTKTFEGSGTSNQNRNLLSNVLTALGTIRPMYQDVDSCSGNYSGEPAQSEKSYKSTWDGNDCEQNKGVATNNPEALNISNESKLQSITRSRSFIRRFSAFKNRSVSQEDRCSPISQEDSNISKYLENTSKGRESLFSLSPLTSDNMELLQRTTIADLIRAMEDLPETNASSEAPLRTQHKERSKIKAVNDVQAKCLRRESLRPVHDYTTVFTSNNFNLNREPARSYPTNASGLATPKRATKRIRTTSSTIPTIQEHQPASQS